MNTLKHLSYYSILAVLLLAKAATSYASAVAYTYDAAGRIVAADYGTGKSISYAYDNAGNLILSFQPAPGLLVSRASASQIALFWPVAPGGFMLYSSGTLGAGAQWNLSGTAQFQTGDLNIVTQAVSPHNTFYRLQK
jgi:YD repeat-containing protein